MHWTGTVTSVAFQIGSLKVAWYGIIITCAMLLAIFLCIKRFKVLNISADNVLGLFLAAIPVGVIGARIGYVISNYSVYFVSPYNWDAFVHTIAIWEGGLTIMWGVPFGIAGALIWSLCKHKNIFRILDLGLCVVLLAQSIGRWGNFFNQELYGQMVTDPAMQWFPYAVYIAREGAFFQATFFYESILNLIGFGVLFFLTKHLDVVGFGTAGYVFWYTMVRGTLEIIRNETSVIDSQSSVNLVMVFCYVVAGLALITMITLIILKKKRGGQMWYKKGIPPLPLTEKEKAEKEKEELAKTPKI